MTSSQQHKQLRIIIAGGGTGGHIFPAIAVAQAIQQIQPDAIILFVGAEGKMEMEKVPKAGYEIKGLTIAGFNRTSILKNILLPWKLINSFFQVKKIFKNFKPNVVFGVGGYSSFPVLKYAQSQHIPTFIHESNAFAGKANLWLAAAASKIFTGTKGMEQFFPAHKIKITGNPVRKNILQHHYTRSTALQLFGLQEQKKTVLIIGGSLGAGSINKVIEQNLASFREYDIQLIWQTGQSNAFHYVQAAQDFKNVYVCSFIDDMSAAYCAADVVISRSGAMAVAEICLTGKAALFVPYPHAAEDHQTFNAKVLVTEGAARMVNDSEVAEKLLPTLMTLIHDENELAQMSKKVKALGLENADQVIAQEIINYIQ